MADEQKSLTDVAKNTGELLQEAGTKTTQTVLAHTEKYHDAYTTIDKIVILAILKLIQVRRRYKFSSQSLTKNKLQKSQESFS